MVTVHWNVIVFIIVIVAGIAWAACEAKDPPGDYGIDIVTPLITVALIAFTLIWGGIFWW